MWTVIIILALSLLVGICIRVICDKYIDMTSEYIKVKETNLSKAIKSGISYKVISKENGLLCKTRYLIKNDVGQNVHVGSHDVYVD
jgi:hypothetical protein